MHYVSLCGGGVVTRFILADVAGHGAAVADVARQLRALMRENINRKSHDRLVRELNRQFTELSETPDRRESPHPAEGATAGLSSFGRPAVVPSGSVGRPATTGCRFATAIVRTYLANTRKLTIGNAGHPRPLWYRAATGSWSLLTGGDENESEGVGNLPFGIDGQTAYDQREIALAVGDFLLFYIRSSPVCLRESA